MAPPENNELREANEALESAVQELKTRDTKNMDTIQELKTRDTKNMDTIEQMRKTIDQLTAQLAAQRPQVPPPPPPATQTSAEGQDTTTALPPPPPPPPAPQTARVPHIPLPPMEKFDGVTTSVTEWWMIFITFVTLHGITEASAILTLPFYLTGIAHQWFLNLEQSAKGTLKSVEEAFYSRFKPTAPVNKDVLRVQQGTGESVDKYLYRVRKLAADSTMDESVITFFAQEGLLNQLRTIVIPQRPQSMEELRQQATLAESAVSRTPAPAQLNVAEAVQEGIRAAASNISDLVIATVDSRMSRNTAENDRSTDKQPGPRKRREGPCFRCGGRACYDVNKCPAKDEFCGYCSTKGHVIKVCHTRLIENATRIGSQ